MSAGYVIGYAVCVAQIAFLAWMLIRKERQIDRLLQRIQAPMTVVEQPITGNVPEPVWRNEFTEETEHLQDIAPFMEPAD